MSARHRRNRALFALALPVPLYYLGTWMASSIVWYETDYEHTISQATTPEVGGVEVRVWANPTEGECSRAIWCPMLIRCENAGPLMVGVRLIDPAHQAISACIHSASLQLADGTTVELSLVPDRSQAPGEPIVFFQNASEFIVHTFHPDALRLLQPASLHMDVEVWTAEASVRRHLVIEIAPTILHRFGWTTGTA